jgi:hypothetical protein
MKPRSELYYFVPGQVILHLEHDDITVPQLEEAVDAFLKDEIIKDPTSPWTQLTLQSGQTITFPLIKYDDGKNISLVLMQLNPDPDTDVDDVDGNQEKLIILLRQLYEALGEGIVISDSPSHSIFLSTLTPNSLMSGAPHQPGTGGPGSWPVQAEAPGDNQWQFDLKKIQYSTKEKVGMGILDTEIGDYQTISDYQKIPADIRPKIESPSEEIVEVAILDTAICEEEFEIALNKWPDHPLLLNLWGEEKKLEIKPYRFSDWENINHFSPMGHRYKMPDHGLFVAGIIKTIAPQAQLKLYEVLNKYGMGSYYSISTGLKNVLRDLEVKRQKNREQDIEDKKNREQRLVINLSLVLNLPPVDISDKISDSIQKILRRIVELKNVFVVAAAGNDAPSPEGRPSARYPAACPGVIGVGALAKNSPYPATYSNFCDDPLSEGCMTLGGEAGLENGVLGVYIHNFPIDEGSHNPGFSSTTRGYLRDEGDISPDPERIRYDPNKTGWAWWAGTSFATPIISGLLAAAWGSNNLQSASDAQTFLGQASGSNQTSAGERVIVVTQT